MAVGLVTTLIIEGDLAKARLDPTGRAGIRHVRQALVTGGRSLLDRVPGRPRFGFQTDDWTVSFRLTPEIEHRIRTSGGTLSDEEIAAGMEQLRESDEDTAQRTVTETMRALVDGQTYATEQFAIAISEGDERALHRAWEMARKTFVLRKRLTRLGEERAAWRAANPKPVEPHPGTTRHHAYQPEMAAAPVSVVTEAAPAGASEGKDD